MTRRIEPARKHGSFDPRWLTARPVREVEQPEQARRAAMTWSAVQAWEGEGGALLPEKRPTNRKTREPYSANAAGVGGAALRPRLVFATARSPRPRT
jgi:hypothetical protein